MTMSSIPSRQPCRGPSRREVLRIGSLGFLGLGLDEWFRLRRGRAESARPPKVKNCILIWLAGGPSHIDTFDPKPAAPSTFGASSSRSPPRSPGLQISEVFPNLAKVMDRVTLIRSMTSPEADHDRAAHHMLTGYRPSPALVYPGYGSVVSKVREATRGMLPPYVAVPDAPIFASSGYLTPAYDPFSVSGDPNQESFRVQNLTPPDRLTLERLLSAATMVKKLDDFAHDVPRHPVDLQPRPVRRAGLFAVDLECGPIRVSDQRGVGGGAREVRPHDSRPVVPAGAAAGRGRRFVRHF